MPPTADHNPVIAIAITPIAAEVAIILLRRKSSKASNRGPEIAMAPTDDFRQKLPQQFLHLPSGDILKWYREEEGDNSDDCSSSKEITDYALAKSIEKLSLLRSCGLVSDKFVNVKGKLEQSFE